MTNADLKASALVVFMSLILISLVLLLYCVITARA